MVEGDPRGRRRAARAAELRGIHVDPPAAHAGAHTDVHPPAGATAPAHEPPREGARTGEGTHAAPPRAEAHHPPEAAPAAPVGTLIRGAENIQREMVNAAAREAGVAPDKLYGWWGRVGNVIGNSIVSGATGSTAGFLAKTGAVAAFGVSGGWIPALLGAAFAIPTVLGVRYLTGQHRVAGAIKGGRAVSRMKKWHARDSRNAARYGGGVFVTQDALQEQARRAVHRPAYGAIAGSLAIGVLTGSVVADAHAHGELIPTLKSGASNMIDWTTGTFWEKVKGLWSCLWGGHSGHESAYAHIGSGYHAGTGEGGLLTTEVPASAEIHQQLADAQDLALEQQIFIEDLKEKMQDLNRQLADTSTTNTELSYGIDSLQEEIDLWKNNYAEMQKHLTSHMRETCEVQISQLQAQLDAARDAASGTPPMPGDNAVTGADVAPGDIAPTIPAHVPENIHDAWTGFTEHATAKNPRGAFELFLGSVGYEAHGAEAIFTKGSGHLADIFEKVMNNTPGAWGDFYGEWVRRFPGENFTSLSTHIPANQPLNFETLFMKMGDDGKTIVERMIGIAELEGNQPGAEALRQIAENYHAPFNKGAVPNFLIRIP